MPTYSKSENRGLEAIRADDRKIYSVGISTAGAAEVRMARSGPHRQIIATTIDPAGAAATQKLIAEAGLADRIAVKLEDISRPLKYPDDTFDFVYARLVLHYLARTDLANALSEIYRILKPGGRVFIVVRSVDCPSAKKPDNMYDPETGITTYISISPIDGSKRTRKRFFHTEQSLSEFVAGAGFRIKSVTSYDEALYDGYDRVVKSKHADNLIELLADKKA